MGSGNYLLYWMGSQALWRIDPKEAKGLDAMVAYDWSPADINRDDRLFTAGVRFNEPLPLPIHNTMSAGYVRNRQNQQFVPHGTAGLKTEHGNEFNKLMNVAPMVLLQPLIHYHQNWSVRTV